ncbi:ribosome biogenesis GTPase Der, partial [Patescibacteria group bacterium]|nr:ribosome biogenesis GTPase Der [Patescibacteria group bacterium]
KAIQESDIIIFVVDVQTGLQDEDRNLEKELRKFDKPIILIGNKADNKTLRASINDPSWHRWSLQQPFPVSAKRGTGTGDLLDMIFYKLAEINHPAVPIMDVIETRVSVIGRPNVGKSSLLNSAVGESRFIASDQEHTTREPNDIRITVDDRNYLLVDTAGIRRMSRVNASSKLEKEGVDRSIRAMKQSDVCLLVLDVSQVIHAQDKHLAGELESSGASVIIVANKWDLVEEKDPVTINKYEKYIRANLPMLDWAPILFTSAKTGKRTQEIFHLINKVVANRFTQLDNEEANSFLSQAIMKHKPSRGKGVSHPTIVKFRQVRVNPPVFELHLRQSHVQALNSSYLRFLENLLRQQYAFDGTPIRISVKGRKKSHVT